MDSWAVWTLHISKIVLSISEEVKPGKVKRRNTRDGKKHDSAKQTSVEKQKPDNSIFKARKWGIGGFNNQND